MSTPSDDLPELRYAEYVLGVLDADSRAAVEREMTESEAAAAAVERWRRRLVPLAEEIAPESPPAIPYMASTITETGGRVGWTAAMDIGKARMIVVPASPQPVSAGHSRALADSAWRQSHRGRCHFRHGAHHYRAGPGAARATRACGRPRGVGRASGRLADRTAHRARRRPRQDRSRGGGSSAGRRCHRHGTAERWRHARLTSRE